MRSFAARSVVLLIALGGVSCISHNVDVVPFLAPTRPATLDELEQKLDRMGAVHSLILRVDP